MSVLNDLYIFEMANNHQGSVDHGIKIIQEMGKIARKYKINAAVKFQYRNLDTFIHKDFKDRDDVKHIPRFMSTRLDDNQFRILVEEVHNNGMHSMVTPFDEISVDKCINDNVSIIKIASCSADDWPLLDKIVQQDNPVIASTGGLQLDSIDKLVSFFYHKAKAEYALMHCVALYPSENKNIHMNFLGRMLRRYPGISVGYSGHDAPDNYDIIKVAVSKGATLFERHVGVETDKIKLNAYSMNPAQTDRWVEASLIAKDICGNDDDKIITDDEQKSLLSLKRGVYANQAIKKGDEISSVRTYFAMPCQDGQTTSGELGQYRSQIVAAQDYKTDGAIFEHSEKSSVIGITRQIIHQAKGMLCEAGIVIGPEYEIDLSHHYGIYEFSKYGAIVINLINREYCKKIIVMLPGQQHPNHCHKIKEESFHVLSGDFQLNLEGKVLQKQAGDIILVERNSYHSFSTQKGVVFEEISTTHVKGDSYYEDVAIARLDPMERKTIVEEW